jgi:hypothetical protein
MLLMHTPSLARTDTSLARTPRTVRARIRIPTIPSLLCVHRRYICHRLTHLGNAALDRRDALMRREHSPTTRIPTRIPSLLMRMRRRQLVCASVGGLIKTMSPPLDLRVLMNKIESLSMMTLLSDQDHQPSRQITHLS